jgi:hypothetical protein
MKKLLALVLILAMTSVASAALVEIFVNGDPYTGQDVEGSDIITFLFSEDAMVFGGFGDLQLNVDHGDYVADSAWINPGFTVIPGDIAVQPVGDGFDVFVYGQGFPAPTGDLMGFDFHVPYDLEESALITISHVAGNWNNLLPGQLMDDIVLHVVPEPMTIALLGLGGLFLRRRRS